MRSLSRTLIEILVAITAFLTVAVLFHLGGNAWQFSELTGAIIGGTLALWAVCTPIRAGEKVEPWLDREQIAWVLIACGVLMWGFGESIWRYYVLNHQSPFPSPADIGYSCFPLFVFVGLLLQPSPQSDRGRKFIVLDSLIAMGSMLAIGWYLLLGAKALDSSEDLLAKFIGLYYPISDIALLCCVVLLILRGQRRAGQTRAMARRAAFIVVGSGICFFIMSDFLFNIQQNANTYVEGTWMDLGWLWGLVTIGLAAYLRRFLPATSTTIFVHRLQQQAERASFGFAQLVTYGLVALLFFVLGLNIFSSDRLQMALRPVLFFSTVGVVGLVVLRQILTIIDNEQLAQQQAEALTNLATANLHVEEQAMMISRRNIDLEQGIHHLKEVQAKLANGDLRARAHLTSGELLPLAISLNLMAERLMHLEGANAYARRLIETIDELGAALEHYRTGKAFKLSASAAQFPEISRLLLAMGLRDLAGPVYPNTKPGGVEQPTPSRPLSTPPEALDRSLHARPQPAPSRPFPRLNRPEQPGGPPSSPAVHLEGASRERTEPLIDEFIHKLRKSDTQWE